MPYNHSIKSPITSGTPYTGRADGIFSLNEQVLLKASGAWAAPPAPPAAPTTVTASYSFSTSQATITFNIPSVLNGSTITGYTVISSGGQTVTGTSSPIVMSGLSVGPEYTFTVVANSTVGNSSASTQSNSMRTTVPMGQQVYSTYGAYSWIAPDGVTSVSVVAVGQGGSASGNGGGGAGGGGLGWKNNITVVPGQSYTVGVQGDSYFISTNTVCGKSGPSSAYYSGGGIQYGAVGGTYVGDGGGNGGAGGNGQWTYCGGGGGGAGGYNGNGGNGGVGHYTSGATSGSAGSGGGAGGGGGSNGNALGYSGSGGGGVGLLGQGSSGGGGSVGGGVGGSAPIPGGGGSGGTQGANGLTGGSVNNPTIGQYGGGGGGPGGGGGDAYQHGGLGAVRIIWPGNTRSFPSTNTGNM